MAKFGSFRILLFILGAILVARMFVPQIGKISMKLTVPMIELGVSDYVRIDISHDIQEISCKTFDSFEEIGCTVVGPTKLESLKIDGSGIRFSSDPTKKNGMIIQEILLPKHTKLRLSKAVPGNLSITTNKSMRTSISLKGSASVIFGEADSKVFIKNSRESSTCTFTFSSSSLLIDGATEGESMQLPWIPANSLATTFSTWGTIHDVPTQLWSTITDEGQLSFSEAPWANMSLFPGNRVKVEGFEGKVKMSISRSYGITIYALGNAEEVQVGSVNVLPSTLDVFWRRPWVQTVTGILAVLLAFLPNKKEPDLS